MTPLPTPSRTFVASFPRSRVGTFRSTLCIVPARRARDSATRRGASRSGVPARERGNKVSVGASELVNRGAPHRFSVTALVSRLAIVVVLATASPRALAQRDTDQLDPADFSLLPIEIDRHQEPELSWQEQFRLAHVNNWTAARFGAKASPAARFAATLEARLTELEQECGLTATQRKKLELAGRGDIKRFLDRLDEISRHDGDPGDSPGVIRKKILQELNGLDQKLAHGIFDEGSLFDKVLATVLSDDRQRDRSTESQKVRTLTRFRDALGLSVRRAAAGLRISNRQCDELRNLLCDELSPPRKLVLSDYGIAFLALSKIPDAKIKPIMSLSDWRQIRQLIALELVAPTPEPVRAPLTLVPPGGAVGMRVPRWKPVPGGEPPAPERR